MLELKFLIRNAPYSLKTFVLQLKNSWVSNKENDMKRKCWLYSLRQSTNCYSNYRAYTPPDTHIETKIHVLLTNKFYFTVLVWSEAFLIDFIRIEFQNVVQHFWSDQPAVKMNFCVISCLLPHTTHQPSLPLYNL